MRRIALFSVLSWVALIGCEVENPCDTGQFYHLGRCTKCPAGTKTSGHSCKCEAEGYVFDPANLTCLPAEGTVISMDDGAISDAGAEVIAGLCEEYCTFSRTCIADNATAASVVGPQLIQLGINGGDISGCVEQCIQASTSERAVTSMQCVAEQRKSAACATLDDLTGVREALTIYNSCCGGATADGPCSLTCANLGSSSVGMFLPFCKR